MQKQKTLAVRLLKFFISVGLLVLVVYLARIPIEVIPAFNTYAVNADKNNLHPGALYYSDVPVTLDSARHIREAVQSVDERHRQERLARIAK